MSKKVLVVDDEPAIARLVKMCLAVEGFEVRTANGGFEAIEEIESWHPILIVLDIMMPGMNGYEVCTEIKSKPQFKDIRVVFLSARGNPGDAQQGMSVGADDYILKPFDPDELLEKVKEIIGSSGN